VPRIERHANVVWEGNLARGTGRISAGTGAFTDLDYSLAIRVGKGTEGKTSPEELLAAAHAGCFSTSLAGELTQAGSPPERLDVTSNVVMDEVEGKGHVIVESQLRVRARVAGIEEDTFMRVVGEADEGCPFSRLIKASAKVSIDAQLEVANG
jgi:osmotically inducible protein OsmC